MTSEAFRDARNPLESDPQDPRGRIQQLTQSARIEGQSAWLALLRDREEWNAAPSWAQDEAITAVAAQLGDTSSFLKTEVYECGGQSHRIGTFEHRPTGISLNLIPGGRFTMGSTGLLEFCAQPLREVYVKPLLVGITPVTQAQWDKIGGVDRRQWQGKTRPIEGVSWHEIQSWLADPKVGGQLALPSEAEWEYFCRAGTKTNFSFGDSGTSLKNYAWYKQNSRKMTRPVATKKPNAFGLYDVLGNVNEWCEDRWHETYRGAPDDGSAWITGGRDSIRVYRGGAWNSGDVACRSAHRFGNAFLSSFRCSFLGFRLCRRVA